MKKIKKNKKIIQIKIFLMINNNKIESEKKKNTIF